MPGFLTRPRPAAVRLLGVVSLLLALSFPGLLRAATSSPVDSLLSKLPDPDQWTSSPLESALRDPDPMFKDPAFRHFAASLQGRDMKVTLDSLRTLAVKYPDKADLQFLHGMYAVVLKLYPEAEGAFRTLIAGQSAPWMGWYGLGCVEIAQNHPTEAVASLHKAVALHPKFTDAWILLAVYEIRQGRNQEGVAAAQRVTQIAPAFAVGWGVLGYCNASARKYRDAIASYQKAIHDAPRYAFAYEGLGLCYVQTNRPLDAIKPFKNALALRPKNYVAANELGFCYLRAGQPGEGVKACRQAVAANPRFSQGWDTLGLCYRQDGNAREASAAFAHALQVDPSNHSARLHLDEPAAANTLSSPARS